MEQAVKPDEKISATQMFTFALMIFNISFLRLTSLWLDKKHLRKSATLNEAVIMRFNYYSIKICFDDNLSEFAKSKQFFFLA